MSGLCASGLTCIKRDRVLFDDFSLNLNAGELVYLRGPNGAGKTSLLRILTGLSSPEHGDVTFDGVNINSNPSLYYKNLIYLGHKSALNGALSAIDNLRFWLAQHGIQNKDLTQASNIDNTIYRALENLGLVGLEDVPVRFLSAGQQRRVALSRLWLKPAAVWILDEPFTALDRGMIITTSHQALSSEAGTHRCVDLEYRF